MIIKIQPNSMIIKDEPLNPMERDYLNARYVKRDNGYMLKGDRDVMYSILLELSKNFDIEIV